MADTANYRKVGDGFLNGVYFTDGTDLVLTAREAKYPLMAGTIVRATKKSAAPAKKPAKESAEK